MLPSGHKRAVLEEPMGPIEDLGKAINGIAEGAGRSTVGLGNR
jgi:hypothetical protein